MEIIPMKLKTSHAEELIRQIDETMAYVAEHKDLYTHGDTAATAMGDGFGALARKAMLKALQTEKDRLHCAMATAQDGYVQYVSVAQEMTVTPLSTVYATITRAYAERQREWREKTDHLKRHYQQMWIARYGNPARSYLNTMGRNVAEYAARYDNYMVHTDEIDELVDELRGYQAQALEENRYRMNPVAIERRKHNGSDDVYIGTALKDGEYADFLVLTKIAGEY